MNDTKVIDLDNYIEKTRLNKFREQLISKNAFLQQQICTLLAENVRLTEQIDHLIRLFKDVNIEIIRSKTGNEKLD